MYLERTLAAMMKKLGGLVYYRIGLSPHS